MDFFNIFSGIVGVVIFLFITLGLIAISRYKRCPSNMILVIFGKVGKGKSARCIHGGGAFILPLIQESKYLSLQPMTIDIPLQGALSKQNIRINTPSTFTVAISTEPIIMLNAAERLLGLNEGQIQSLAEDIILGQLRLVIATLDIEEINQDRELFLKQINENVASELNKIGLQLINVNIKDLTDESGYIIAIGKKSAAEAINQAKVEVAEQDRNGAIGESKANREKEVQVSFENAETEKGRKEAERDQRIVLAHFESEGVSEEAKAERAREVEIAKQLAETAKGRKEAESAKRISIAEFEAAAIKGENTSKAQVADYNAELAAQEAHAKEKSEVAEANAQREILQAQQAVELSRLEKDEIVQKEIDKRKVEIAADAEAERNRIIAKGEADAVLMKYEAEANGIRELLKGKADGYKQIIDACDNDPQMAATLMLLEKMEALVEKQVEAISNLQIDKITVWDSGGNDGGTTSNFIKSFVTSLPPLQELAKQAGIELPAFLGSIKAEDVNLDELKKAIELNKKPEAPAEGEVKKEV